MAPICLVLVEPGVAAFGHDEQLDVGRVAASCGDCRIPQPRRVTERDDSVELAVDKQDRPTVARDRDAGADVVDPVSARADELASGEPAERAGDRGGERQVGEPEGLADQAAWIGRRRRADQGGHPWVRGGGQDRPDPAHRVTEQRAGGDLRAGHQGRERGQRVRAELPAADGQVLGAVCAMAADVEGEAVEAGRVEELNVGDHSIPGRVPAVDEGDTGTWGTVVGRDEPGRQVAAGRADDRQLEGQAEVGRAELRWAAIGEAGSGAVQPGEPVGQRNGQGSERRHDAHSAEPGHAPIGRRAAGPVKHVQPSRPRPATARLGA